MSSALVLSIAILLLADIVLLVASFVTARLGFSSYIRKRHPDLWKELAPRGISYSQVRFQLDASPAMRRFRVASFDDHGDKELGKRRLRANRYERAALFLWIATALWTVAVCIILAFLKGN